MNRLIPDKFLTIRQAAAKLAVAMYAGKPDRAVVTRARASGFDVADGTAIDDATSELWSASDRETIQAFVVGPRIANPLKLPFGMSEGIPALRSPRGGDFSFLRP